MGNLWAFLWAAYPRRLVYAFSCVSARCFNCIYACDAEIDRVRCTYLPKATRSRQLGQRWKWFWQKFPFRLWANRIRRRCWNPTICGPRPCGMSRPCTRCSCWASGIRTSVFHRSRRSFCWRAPGWWRIRRSAWTRRRCNSLGRNPRPPSFSCARIGTAQCPRSIC